MAIGLAGLLLVVSLLAAHLARRRGVLVAQVKLGQCFRFRRLLGLLAQVELAVQQV